MELRRPPCGEMGTHAPHGFFALPGPAGLRGEAWTGCPGCSEKEAASLALAVQMIRLPQEARTTATLQCNPWVSYCLFDVLVPGYQEFVSQMPQSVDGVVSQGLGIPVMRCPAMERGTWKLTVRDGRDTIAEGTIPVVLAGES